MAFHKGGMGKGVHSHTHTDLSQSQELVGKIHNQYEELQCHLYAHTMYLFFGVLFQNVSYFDDISKKWFIF